MPFVPIGEAAVLLNTSTDTVRRLVDDGQLEGRRTKGGHRHIDTRSVARLLRERAPGEALPAVHRQSARNRFRGVVTRVLKDKVTAQVDVQAGPHRLVSLMTREAADELRLEPGTIVVAAVKATNVVIETIDALPG